MELNGKKAQLKPTTKPWPGSQQRERYEPLSPNLVAGIFAKFSARYGHKWTSSIPTVDLQRLAVSEWSLGLAGVTAQEIRNGLDNWDADWPPSLPEFKKVCINGKLTAACHQPFPKLEKPKNPMRRDRSLGEFLRELRSKVLG